MNQDLKTRADAETENAKRLAEKLADKQRQYDAAMRLYNTALDDNQLLKDRVHRLEGEVSFLKHEVNLRYGILGVAQNLRDILDAKIGLGSVVAFQPDHSTMPHRYIIIGETTLGGEDAWQLVCAYDGRFTNATAPITKKRATEIFRVVTDQDQIVASYELLANHTKSS